MKNEIMNKATRAFGKFGLKLQKHSPEILVVGGVVGMIGTCVLASKATLKVNTIVEETKEQLDVIHNAAENLEAGETLITETGEVYSLEDVKKDTTIVYAHSALKFAKLYGPTIALGTLSITAILAGHNILRKRNVALAAAYNVLDKSFKDYRGRVVDRFGKELDRELRYNIKTKQIEEKVVNEDGTEATVKKEIRTIDANGLEDYSEYAKVFDEACKGFSKDPDANRVFLKMQQSQANDILRRRGYLFLNEVYDMLGIPRTPAGQIVGWIYDEECPNGDNCVDFGMYDIHKEKVRDFINGYERCILLDFNVDGPIVDMI